MRIGKGAGNAQHFSPNRVLTQLESVIERGLQSYLEVGQAIDEINERELYREQGFASFDEYCKQRWKFARSAVAQNATLNAERAASGGQETTTGEGQATAASKKRGRPSLFSAAQIEKAVQMKAARSTNNEIAKSLYGVDTTTSSQRRSVPTILKHHTRLKKDRIEK
jgi:hypothetical protein